MKSWDPGWLGSMIKIIVIKICVKVYGENEWAHVFLHW